MGRPRDDDDPRVVRGAQVVFLAVGEDKAGAAARAFGEPPSRATPASLVRSASGTTVVVLDEAAAAGLRRRQRTAGRLKPEPADG